MLEHLGGDGRRGAAPRARLVGSSPQIRERRAAVGRHPAHHLRRRVVAGLCAIRPDALVRLSPLRHRGVDLAAGDRPDRARQSPSGKRRNRRRIDEGRSHVVLCSSQPRCRRVPASRRRTPPGGELGLVRRVVAIQAVQVLERPFAMGHVRQEREKVVRLPAEAERVQRPKRPRRVAHERIAKVPVPHAARDAREDVVAAAAIAPVGEWVSAFSVSALRCRCVRHGWSGKRPFETQRRQCSAVRSTRANASSTVSGGSTSAHESATNARSDSRSVVRADARPPSKPSRRLVTSRRFCSTVGAAAIAEW